MEEPIGPVEALKLALEKETEAVELYQRFASEHPEAKEIFWFLLNEEQKHQKLIREKIVQLTT